MVPQGVTGGAVHWRVRGGTRRTVVGRDRVSAFGRFEEPSQGVLGSSRVVPMGLGEEIESSLDAHDGDGEVGQAGEVAREVSGAHPAPVFVVGDVAHVVKSIHNAPVPSHEGEDEFAGGLLGYHLPQCREVRP